jgi:hypothetical protein
MKLWITLGTLLSLLTGTQGTGDGGRRLADSPAGYSIEEDDFYVWDEDREEAERWATDLAGSRPSHRV